MTPPRESSSRQVPASVWWCIVFAAYSWGYAEGRRAGSLEGFSRAVRIWAGAYKDAIR
jgi:hypothetical protein